MTRTQIMSLESSLKLTQKGLFLVAVAMVFAYCALVIGVSRVASEQKHLLGDVSELRSSVATLETSYALAARSLTEDDAHARGLAVGTRVFADRASVAFVSGSSF